jgi:predicted small secreted protein
MPLAWIKHLPIMALLLSAAVTVSGCNTIGGTIGGVGRDLTAIGDTFSDVDDDCRTTRCGKQRVRDDCGPRGCRQLRAVVSRCAHDACGRGVRGRPLRY